MDLSPYILPLAEEDGLEGLIKIGAIVLFLVIGAIAALAGKLKERARQKEAERAKQQRDQSIHREPPAPPQPRPSPAEQQVRAQQVIAQLFGIPQEQATPPPPPPPPPKAEEPPARLGGGVEAEVVQLERGLAADEAERHRRLDRLADHGTHVRIVDAPGPDRQAAVRVDLGARPEAQKAIIYAEILGRPKGLRTDPEPWDQ
jgi:hypothetical protein